MGPDCDLEEGVVQGHRVGTGTWYRPTVFRSRGSPTEEFLKGLVLGT